MESALKRVDLAAVEVQKSSVTDRRSTSWTHLERLPGAIDRPRWKSFRSLRLVTGASSTPHDTTLNFCLSAQQQKSVLLLKTTLQYFWRYHGVTSGKFVQKRWNCWKQFPWKNSGESLLGAFWFWWCFYFNLNLVRLFEICLSFFFYHFNVLQLLPFA